MSERNEQASQLVKRYTTWAAVGGLFPVPTLDLAAIAAAQLRMMSKLSALYEVPFSKERGRSIATALIGSLVPTDLAYGAVGMLIKLVPVVGPVAGAFAMPAFAAGATYAVGRVFTQHLEVGGTLLDFDITRAKKRVKEEFETHQESKATGAKATKPAPA